MEHLKKSEYSEGDSNHFKLVGKSVLHFEIITQKLTQEDLLQKQKIIKEGQETESIR